VSRLRNSPATLEAFVAVYGEAVLDDPQAALQDMGLAIAA
jgi:cytochrome c peroxidase